MKIGISAIHVRPGKSGSHQPYLVNLVSAMSMLETPHEFILFVTPANQYLFENARDKMEFVVYPALAEEVLPRIFLEQMWLPLDAHRRKIDVLHYPGTTASFLLRQSDVVTVHHDSVTQRISMSSIRNIYYDTALMIIKRAGRIIAPSQVYADELVKYFGYRPERVQPVHHGVSSIFRNVASSEVEKVREKYGIEPNAILTITNTRPHKNIPNLLRAYHLLITRYCLENQLVMVGYIEETVLMQIISDISDDPEHMRSRINVIPFLPHEQLPPIYSAAAVFVFFSKVETFGMPLVEAMACGLPVVASDIPIHREILQSAGLLVPPEAPDALAAAFHKILTNKEYRSLLVQSALSRSQQFSWEKTARQTLRVYEDSWSSTRKD
ncbi:MAG: glycosyltransferase family 1 protein [bacterium]|nr:glycosyltransferase family 1 protein [bacterium]